MGRKIGVTTREDVYATLDGERTFQNSRFPRGNLSDFSIGEELLLIEEYVRKARAYWTKEAAGEELDTLNSVRKIAAIAVRCLEKHGAPRRAAPGCEHVSGPDRCSDCAYES